MGYEGKDGLFHVQDICFPNYPPPSLLSTTQVEQQEDDCLVAFCSGLNVSNQQNMLHDLFVSYMVGDLTNQQVNLRLTKRLLNKLQTFLASSFVETRYPYH